MKKLLVVFVVVGLLAGATAYYRTSNPRAPHYPTARIDYGPIAEVIRGTGLIEVRNAVVVSASSPLATEVIEVSPEADFGRNVKKGQKLAQLDDRPATLKFEEAKALLEAATKDRDTAQAALTGATAIVKRMEKSTSTWDTVEGERLKAELPAAQAKLEAAEAKIRQAAAGVRLAEWSKSVTTISAPAEGVIIDRKVVPGQMVGGPLQTTPLFIIAPNMAEMRVLAQIAQADIGRVLPGQKATISLFTSAEKPAERTATIRETRVAPTVLPGATQTPGNVFYSAVIDVSNTKLSKPGEPDVWELRHGMTADVTIYIRPEEIAWKVDKGAIDLDLEPQHITSRARARLDQWHALNRSPDVWKRIWVLDNNEPWPVFIRVVASTGDKAIQDEQFTQFFEWDWGDANHRVLSPANVDSIAPVIVNKPESTPGAIERLLKSFKPAG